MITYLRACLALNSHTNQTMHMKVIKCQGLGCNQDSTPIQEQSNIEIPSITGNEDSMHMKSYGG